MTEAQLIEAAKQHGHKWYAKVSRATAEKMFTPQEIEAARRQKDGYLGPMPKTQTIGLFLDDIPLAHP